MNVLLAGVHWAAVLCHTIGRETLTFCGASRRVMELVEHKHTLEKVAPWSVISGSFAVCISPLRLLQVRP